MSRAKARQRRGGSRSRLALRVRDAHTVLWLTRLLWRPVAREVFVARSWIAPRRRRSPLRIASSRRRTRRR
jgi:hypothetical protein